MRRVDENFFRQNFYTIQNVLSKFHISECQVHFAGDAFGTVTMYLAFQPFGGKVFNDVEVALNAIFSGTDSDVQYINLIFLFGQRLKPELPTIDFAEFNSAPARCNTPVRAVRPSSPARDGVFATPQQPVDGGLKRKAEETPEQSSSEGGLSFYEKRSNAASGSDFRATTARKSLFTTSP